jgi:hypothetical protein
LDFFLVKKSVINGNGMTSLVAATRSMDSTTRLHGASCIKNLVFMSDDDTKKAVMKDLTFNGLLE